MIDPRVARPYMQPEYHDYAWVVEQIRADVPISRLRQDLIYELFRRGVLEADSGNTLRLSSVGEIVAEKLIKGERAPELD